eukprot:5866232-Amphidinium_carterae.1
MESIEKATLQTSSRLEALVSHVDKSQENTQTEMSKLASALTELCTQQRSQWSAMDARLDEKMEKMGSLLLSKLNPKKRSEPEDPDASMDH